MHSDLFLDLDAVDLAILASLCRKFVEMTAAPEFRATAPAEISDSELRHRGQRFAAIADRLETAAGFGHG